MEITKLYAKYKLFLIKPIDGIVGENNWNRNEVDGSKQYEIRKGKNRYTALIYWKNGQIAVANINNVFIDEKILSREISVVCSRQEETLAIMHLFDLYEAIKKHN